MLLLCKQEVTGSIIGPDADYGDSIFVVFPTFYRHMFTHKRLKLVNQSLRVLAGSYETKEVMERNLQ